MKNITRRGFITKALLALSSSIASTSISSNQIIKSETLSDSQKFQHECFIVYQKWIEKEHVSPEIYLQNSIKNIGFVKPNISELTKIDFQDKNFFYINGLTLGKTEAAYLALIGSNVDS